MIGSPPHTHPTPPPSRPSSAPPSPTRTLSSSSMAGRPEHPIGGATGPIRPPTPDSPPRGSHSALPHTSHARLSHSRRSSGSHDSEAHIVTAVNTPHEYSPQGHPHPLEMGGLCLSKRDSLPSPTSPHTGHSGHRRKRRYTDEKGEKEDGSDAASEKHKHNHGANVGSDSETGEESDNEAVQALETEVEVRENVDERGNEAHRNMLNGKEGVKERKEVVDLGNGLEEVIVVDWLPGDPDNPFNWSDHRKYAIVITAVFITFCTTANLTSVAIMSNWGTDWFGVNREVYTLSLTVPMISISFTPMVLAPLSEVYGRNMIYQITSVITALLFVPQALSHSFAGLLVARWFQGMASSVGNSMVGGSVADLFRAEDRGLAMNVFSIVIFIGQAFGPLATGWIGMRYGIQWCYGVQGFIGVFSCIVNAVILRETRGDVLLSRRARRLTKQTGVKHICAADLQRQSFTTLMKVSLIRPFQYLATEPIVTALSAWMGFAWGVIFLGGTSVSLVFQAYGFNIGETGSIQLVILIGGCLGFASNYHQEYLYRRAAIKNGGRAPPEARLYWAAYGGLMFPLAMFVFAWTGRPEIHWVVPALFLCIAYWGVYCMYSGIFNYLADAYETYSSSAQAAQSFARNILSGVFPLFARQMYIGLGYPQATTLIASIAMVLAAAPILLIFYGKSLRARSKVASALAKDSEHR